MSYHLEAGETVEEGIRRIAAEQIDSIFADLDDDDLDVHDRVHEVRKRCKKLRGLVRLVRPAFDGYSEANATFRDAARTLSDVRDAASRVECLDALAERFEGEEEAAFAEVRKGLTERRSETADALDLADRLTAFRETMEEARGRIAGWELSETGWDAVAGGLAKTYGRGRRRMAEAREEPTVEVCHEWRKRVKYHRYHCRLLRQIWVPLVWKRRQATKRLSDLLGDHHDLALLREELGAGEVPASPAAVEAVAGLAEVRRKELEAWSLPLGRRLYVEKPKRLTRRFGAYWEAWRAEEELARGIGEASGEVYS